jgi:hypothetical protein
VFSVQTKFPSDDVSSQGVATEYVRTGDGGAKITFRFCPQCGSTVYYTIDCFPGWIVIPVGAFADSTFPAPTYSVYEERMHSWVQLPDGIERVF